MTRLVLALITMAFISCGKNSIPFVCTPCNLSCDSLTFSKAGNCPHCGMLLTRKSDLKKEVNTIEINEGSGYFVIQGGQGKKYKQIKVFYHRPRNFKKDSKVLIVVPGDGRNGDSYRDTWVQESENYGVLILSPMYAENDYPFEGYHMGGLLYDMNLKNSIQRVVGSNVVNLDESSLTINPNKNQNEWLFNDFDRIFELVTRAAKMTQTRYDIFGHSAGGQILHRFVLFHPHSKADRILASNSGFYTLPDFETELPFGTKNTILSIDSLKSSFNKSLVLWVGELDNETETHGNLLRSITADKQGLHRLERARYFYNQSKNLARQNGFDFNWRLEIVPGVGHDQRKMGAAAAKFLYGK